jgi:hypothetical protein
VSEYFFGLGRGRVSDDRIKALDEIGAEYGAVFCNPSLPGDGPRYWFAGPNQGHPFDQAMAKAVIGAAEAAGLWPPTRANKK